MKLKTFSKSLDKITAQAERKRTTTLQQQKDLLLQCVKRVENLLKKSPHRWGYELREIQKIKFYIQKHAFLPESYQDMLIEWYAYAKSQSLKKTKMK